jgi:hypothetical protein
MRCIMNGAIEQGVTFRSFFRECDVGQLDARALFTLRLFLAASRWLY